MYIMWFIRFEIGIHYGFLQSEKVVGCRLFLYGMEDLISFLISFFNKIKQEFLARRL